MKGLKKNKGDYMKNAEVAVVEKDAVGAPVKDVKWHGTEIEVKPQDAVIQDPGTGKPLLLRKFEFAFRPGMPKPTKKQLLEGNAFEHFLWRDGLVQVDKPRIHITDKSFTIYVPCQARGGYSFDNRDVKNATELLTKNESKK